MYENVYFEYMGENTTLHVTIDLYGGQSSVENL